MPGGGGGGSFSRNAFVQFGFTTHTPRLRCTARFVCTRGGGGERKEIARKRGQRRNGKLEIVSTPDNNRTRAHVRPADVLVVGELSGAFDHLSA